MKLLRPLSALCLALAAPAFAAVTVSSPANNSTVSSPVQYTASATATSCAKGVAAMGIYVNNQLAYKVNGTSLNTALTLSAGTYKTVVQEWDNCGGATNTPVNITVSSANPAPPPPPPPTPPTPPTQNGVSVTTPANGSMVGSPVAFSATASTTACAKGVAAMGIYVGGTLKYQVNGAALNTSLAFPNGAQSATVQEWDYCGGALKTVTSFTVGSASATTVSLNASPSAITSGGSSTIAVSATNATAVTLAGSDGSSYTLSPTGGTQVVKPTATTTYTATATGSAGNMTASTTVTVGAATATVTLSASPASITSGSSSTLTVTASNATSVVLSGSDGSSYTLSPTGGTQVVKPTATTTYTATATGSAGNMTASTTVTVGAATATVTLSASPASITSGSSSTLTVTATNATSVVLSGSDGSSYTLSPTGGTQVVSPTATTTYTATAAAVSGNVTATATVTLASSGSSSVSLVASPGQLAAGGSSTITVTAANATGVVLTGSDGSSYTLSSTGGTQTVAPSTTTTYTATATGGSATFTASKTITVTSLAGLSKVNHVVFMLQENHSFDNYFGMLNPYRVANGFNVGLDGNTYTVDGIDDKLTRTSNSSDEGTAYAPFKFTSTCVDDMTSSWLESYGDVSRYDFTPKRGIVLDGFVHTAENYAKTCAASNGAICSGTFSDLNGKRAMGYYDQGFLNYYYYMASQYAVSDRWFSPISSKSKPNRIATFTGGTTLGLVFDPGLDDHLQQLQTSSIFQQLDQQKVGWKIYYTVTQGSCTDPTDCPGNAAAQYPATNFGYISLLHPLPVRKPQRRRLHVDDGAFKRRRRQEQLLLHRPQPHRPAVDLLHRSEERHAARLRLHRSRLRQQ